MWMTSRRITGNPTFTALAFGLLGGLVGAIVMGLVAYTVPVVNIGGNPFFIAAATFMGFGTLSWMFGWLLHVMTGMGIGAIFGFVVSRVSRLRNLKIGPGIVAGIGVGLIAWVVLFLPVMSLLTPALVSAGLSGGGLIVNILFGVILAAMFAVGQLLYFVEPEKAAQACKMCGATFPSAEELGRHQSEEHMRVETEHTQRA
jgi:hypothetical protein